MSDQTNNRETATIVVEDAAPHHTTETENTGAIEEDGDNLDLEEYEVKAKFTLFTEQSFQKLIDQKNERKRKAEGKVSNVNAGKDGGRLVDGNLVYDDEDEEEDVEFNPDLVEGTLLPDPEEFPVELKGKPLEEIDKYIKYKSFVVINSRFTGLAINRYSATKALNILTPWNKIRQIMLLIVTNQFFDLFIILTIVANCIFLSLNEDYVIAEYVFLAIYTFEFVSKVIARGLFLNHHTFLRDPWNWLDILVIITSYVELGVQNSNLNIKFLRAFRVFRVLKTVTIIPGLKTMMSAILKSLFMLLEVIVMTLFVMSVFALFGLQVYMGALRNKCVRFVDWTKLDFTTANETIIDNYYFQWVSNSDNWIENDGDYILCGNISGAGRCDEWDKNSICLAGFGGNPNWGYTNFDDFGWSLLTVFQLVTLDFWEDAYNKVVRVSGPWNILFFIVVVFFGSFYLLNLMLAVVTMSYEEEAKLDGKEKEKEQARLKRKREAMKKKKKKKVKDAKEKDSHKKKGDPHKKVRHPEDTPDTNNVSAPVVVKPNLKSYNAPKELKKKIEALNSPKKTSSGVPIKSSGLSKPRKPIKFEELVEASKDKPVEETPTEEVNEDDAEINEEDDNFMENKNSLLDDPDNPPVFPVEIKISEDEILYDRNCPCCTTKPQIFHNWLRFQNKLYIFAQDAFFEVFITLCIVVNTAIMATEHYPSTPEFDSFLEISNYVFIGVFTIEAFVKLFGMSKEYFYSPWNIFDLVIVLISYIDLAVQDIQGLSVIRTFRLFRVFKLAQSWSTMRNLLTIILSAISALGSLTLILLIFMFIFAVIGKQLFQGTYSKTFENEPNLPRWNFEDIGHALMLVFRILCGEWIEPLWDCMRGEGALCVAVFIPSLVLGNFMILNLFLALLLNSFASDSLGGQEEAEESKFSIAFQRIKIFCCSSKVADEEAVKLEEEKKREEENKSHGAIKNGLKPENQDKSKRKRKHDPDKTAENKENENNPDNPNLGNGAAVVLNQPENNEEDDDDDDKPVVLQDCCCEGCYRIFEKECCAPCVCCMCSTETDYGARWQAFRSKMLEITEHKVFEAFILLIILASTVSLCLEDIYLNDNPTLVQALYILNIIFAVIFSLEMIIKWISLGFKVYFTNFGSILDFFIVLITIIDLVINETVENAGNLTWFRPLRSLRALRPLKVMTRIEGIKIVVNALMKAIPAILNVLVVCLLFWMIFSIIGVQLFKGKFFKCVDISSGERISQKIVANKTACLAQNQSWRNSKINFDNSAGGLLALYQVATFEGWMELMIDAIDSNEIDLQPVWENKLIYYLYFVIYIFIGSFFTLNLLIGVIIDNFNKLKKKYEGNYVDVLLTETQRNYYNTIRKVVSKKPQKTIKRPKNSFLAFMYDVSISTKFELAIIILIFLNMIAMMVEHYNQPKSYTVALDMINIIFTTIFALEAIVKIIGLGWHYFRAGWNIFDFIIVILSIIGIVLTDILTNVFVTPTLLRVVRIFRISRVLRLLKVFQGIRKLLFAIIISMPALVNIGSLLLLIVVIYAIIGMSVFGNVKHTGVFDDLVNFETFGNTMLLLFRLTTAGGWNDILDPLLITEPDCDPNYVYRNDKSIKIAGGNCGTPWLAMLYMISYILITFLIIINMYIAVILENFNQAHEQEEVGVTEDDFDMFYMTWERYDNYATQFIKYEQLSDFVAELDEPFHIKKPNIIAITAFDLPIRRNERVHCLDILLALIRHRLGNVEHTDEFEDLKGKVEEQFKQIFPVRSYEEVITTTMRMKKEEIAAKILQRSWRRHKAQKTFRKVTENAIAISPKNLLESTNDIEPASLAKKFGSEISLQELPEKKVRAVKTVTNTKMEPPKISQIKDLDKATSDQPSIKV